MQPLLKLDITDLSQLHEPDGKHIIDGCHLKRLRGKVKPKHITALNRLATLMHEAPGHDNDTGAVLRQRNTSPTLERSARLIHPDNMHITALAANPFPATIPFPACHPDQTLIKEYLQGRGITPSRHQTDVQIAHAEHTATADTKQHKRTRHPNKEPTMYKGQARKRQSLHRSVAHSTAAPDSYQQPGQCPCQDHSYKE